MLAQLLNDAPPARQPMRTEYAGSERRKPAPRPAPRRRKVRRWEMLYQRMGVSTAMAAMCLGWAGFWLINGYFTVQALGTLGVPVLAAWVVQVAASLIEGHLWRTRIAVLYPFIILVGVLDVLSSAWGLFVWIPEHDPFGLMPQGMAGYVVLTLVAMVIALAPEPLMMVMARWFADEREVRR